MSVGSILQIGRQSFRHAWRDATDIRQADEHARDLEKARAYVQALLPPPVSEGPIRADWVYEPSAKLGGDAFGYGRVSEHRYAAYLIDVSGHGAGAALHGVAVMNVLRQRALPNTDMSEPAEVLAALNAMFQMDSHAGLYFTIWYGVYDIGLRKMKFASAGHHPGYLTTTDRTGAAALRTRNSVIGAMPGVSYRAEMVDVPPGARLYLFSDGAFEIVTAHGAQWALTDFLPLLNQPPLEGTTESRRLFEQVRSISRPGGLDDDFSALVVTFD